MYLPNGYDMDSNPNTSAYYSEEDSNTSSSQEELRLFSRKPNNETQEEATRRAGADPTTMSRDPTQEIVLRILKQIQAGLDEVSPKMGTHRRDGRTSSGDPDEAAMPNKKDETTHPTTEEENAHPDNQARQRWEHPSTFNAPGPHILSRYDVVMVKILKGNTIDAKRGVVTRCLGDNMYMVNVGASVYRKHRTQLLPLTRKLTQDSKALANYRPARAESKISAIKAKPGPASLLDPEMEEHMLKLWKLRQQREDYRRNNSQQTGAVMDSKPKCPNMWHRVGPSVRQRTGCHKCSHQKQAGPTGEEGSQYHIDF